MDEDKIVYLMDRLKNMQLNIDIMIKILEAEKEGENRCLE